MAPTLTERPGDGRFDDERKLSGHRRIIFRTLHGMIQAIERLLPFINAETALVLGHGPIANRDDLVNFYDTLA